MQSHTRLVEKREKQGEDEEHKRLQSVMRFRQAQNATHFLINVKPVNYKTRLKPLMIPKVFKFSKLTKAIFNFRQSNLI